MFRGLFSSISSSGCWYGELFDWLIWPLLHNQVPFFPENQITQHKSNSQSQSEGQSQASDVLNGRHVFVRKEDEQKQRRTCGKSVCSLTEILWPYNDMHLKDLNSTNHFEGTKFEPIRFKLRLHVYVLKLSLRTAKVSQLVPEWTSFL